MEMCTNVWAFIGSNGCTQRNCSCKQDVMDKETHTHTHVKRWEPKQREIEPFSCDVELQLNHSLFDDVVFQ